MNDTYYMSSDEIPFAVRQYDNDLYQSFADNGEVIDTMDSFVSDSVDTLMGDTWNAVRGDLANYMDYANVSADLNKLINETQESCLQEIQNFLSPDNDLNTADLPKFEEERDRLNKEIQAARDRIDSLKAVPAKISKEVTEIGPDGKPYTYTKEIPNEPAYSDAQNEIANIDHQINSELQPALDEAKRLIDKINEFNNVVLPRIQKRLDDLQEKVNTFARTIDALGTSNIGIYRRYLEVGLKPNSDKIAKFYFDESGLPYAVDYLQSHIYIDYTDPDNPKYSRFDPKTHELSPISIFDDENMIKFDGNKFVFNPQYGADQMAFRNNFSELINDPLIWEEMQKHFPVESFESEDAAMEFYERYFNNITETGCGYAAGANIIFKEFEGRETEFEETFGFPMYTVDTEGAIDFNYEAMELKFFNNEWVNQMKIGVTIDQMEAGQDFEYTMKYYNEIDQVPDELQEEYWDNRPIGTSADLEYELNDFLYDYGININTKSNALPVADGATINQSMAEDLKNNDYVVYAGTGYDLYFMDKLYCSNGGSHYMMLTGEFAEDGKPFVSSWGMKFSGDISGNGEDISDNVNYYVNINK